jgi:hypothetical protein
MVFGGLFQSINSPSVGESLLSGLSTSTVLVGLILLWRRVTRDKSYSMEELLPTQKQFRWLLVPTGIMYLAMGILLRPDWYPGFIGHLMIWILYGISFFLLSRSRKTPQVVSDEVALEPWENKRWLILAGIFPVAATAGELLLGPIANALALIFWLGGIAFGVIMFIKAVRQTFPKGEETQQV